MKAYGGMRLFRKGREAHSYVERFGWFLESVVEMHAVNCTFLVARFILDMLMDGSIVPWKVLMQGIITLICFKKM